MIRVAMVSEHASPLAVLGGVDAGGQNVHVASLASALADSGLEVTVYTRRDDPGLPERVELCPGVLVEHLDAGPPEAVPKDELLPHVPAMARELSRRLRLNRPAVLHAHFWMSGLAAASAGRELGIPVVQTFHALGTVKRRFQGHADTSPASRIPAERCLARTADRLLASCTDEVRELVSLGAPRSHIDVVPSGVDNERFTPDGPTAPRTYRRRLLVVGRLVPRKGVDDAIAAMQWIPDAELVIAGGPDVAELERDREAMRLQRLADELGVADSVQLIGRLPHDQLPAHLRAADLAVCLPWYEPFGIVPLEAMACGVPVVGSAVGGLLDTVIDGVTGVLLPPHDPDLAATAIRGLLADDTRRKAYGMAGAERVAAHYDWRRVARSTERSYLRALASGSADSGRKERVG
jgi:glycosyltransferase involved in cell wall biosynthesis